MAGLNAERERVTIHTYKLSVFIYELNITKIRSARLQQLCKENEGQIAKYDLKHGFKHKFKPKLKSNEKLT